MHQIHPDEGLQEMNLRVVTAVLKYRLFTNNLTLGRATVYVNFTEATGGTGYAAVNLDEVDFSIETVSGLVAYMQAADVVFSVSSGSQTVYGYYVTDASNSKVIACGTFAGGPLTLDASNPITVPAKIALQARFIAA